MAFVYNTGIGRASEVIISRTVGGVTEEIARPSMITQDWSINGRNYVVMSVSDFHFLTDAEYNQMRNDFVDYVNSQYAGLTLTADGSVIVGYEPEGYIS